MGLQHGLWQQTLDTSSTLSPVASAAYLLEARLHISQQTHHHPHAGLQQQPQSATQRIPPAIPKLALWSMGSVSGTDPNMQELGRAAQQQLSSCVMVK